MPLFDDKVFLEVPDSFLVFHNREELIYGDPSQYAHYCLFSVSFIFYVRIPQTLVKFTSNSLVLSYPYLDALTTDHIYIPQTCTTCYHLEGPLVIPELVPFIKLHLGRKTLFHMSFPHSLVYNYFGIFGIVNAPSSLVPFLLLGKGRLGNGCFMNISIFLRPFFNFHSTTDLCSKVICL